MQISRKTEERTLLNELIPKFDQENGREICKKILLDARALNHDIKKLVPSPDDEKIQIKWLEDDVCFRISFSLPVLLLFHVSTRHSREIHGYFKPTYQDFTRPSGFVPVYNCNLNHLSLLKTHAYEKTRQWFTLNADEEKSFICKKFQNNSGQKMIQSSLNFILQYDSEAENVTDFVEKTVGKCFKYQYWRPPAIQKTASTYSTVHNMLYNSWKRIYSYHRIYKTFVRIQDLADKRYTFHFAKKKLSFSHGEASILVHDVDHFFTRKTTSIVFAEPDRSKMNERDVINCMVDMPILPKLAKPPNIIVTGVVGLPLQAGDLKPVIGLIAWKITQNLKNHRNLCWLSNKEELKNSVFDIVNNNIVFGTEWIKNFNANFESSLANLFPLFVESDGEIFYIPPPLMSYILSRQIPILDDKEELVKLLKLVDLVTMGSRFGLIMKLRTSKLGHEVQMGPCKRHWNSILQEIPRVANRIYYSRVFAQSPVRVV